MMRMNMKTKQQAIERECECVCVCVKNEEGKNMGNEREMERWGRRGVYGERENDKANEIANDKEGEDNNTK